MIPTAQQLLALSPDGPVKLRITKRPSVGPSPHVEVTAEVVSLKRGIVAWRDEDGRTITPRDSWLYETLRGVPVGAAIATTPAEKVREAREHATVGPFVIEGSITSRKATVRHAQGGLVPTGDGRVEAEVAFADFTAAREHAVACFNALLAGRSAP